jgi:PAS domain S-box-containing protein
MNCRHILLALSLTSIGALHDARGAEKNVLVLLQTSGGDIPELFWESFSTSIRQDDDVELFREVFDFERFEGRTYESTMGRYLREKYADIPLDVVVALGPGPFGFLMRERESLFPAAPLVFAGLAEQTVAALDLPMDVTGVIGNFDVDGTVDLARALQPDARRIVVVSGVSPTDLIWNARASERLAGIDALEVTHLSGEPIAGIENKLRRLEPDSIVIMLTVIEDGAGERIMPPSLLVDRLSEASAAPMYGVYEAWLGRGIVGGYVDTVDTSSAQAGEIVSRILAGESARDIPIVRGERRYIVDSRALDRWDLDEARLPAGTIVQFREASVWDEYRVEILGALGLILLQSLLIVVLLLRAHKRRVERKLERVENRYRNVVEAQTDLVCRYLPDTTLTFVNDAYCRYFERTKEQLIGTRLIDQIPPSDREDTLKHVESLVSHPRTEMSERRILRTDGGIAWQQWVDHSIVENGNGVVEIQAIGRDITELKVAEHEAQQQREQVTHLTRVAILGELAGALAHELNQPLTAILSNAQSASLLLSREPPDIAEVRGILDDIEADDKRAGEIIARLRTMLKKGRLKFQPVQINDVVDEALALVHAQFIEWQVNVRKVLADDLPPVFGDRVQLLQVLLNLIVNANEAMSDSDITDRELIVSTEYLPDEGNVLLAVTDNGHGVDEESAARMFDPFYTTKESGLGLGLAICRSIVGGHGGRLSARANPDRGLTVSVCLPKLS